MVLKQAAKEQVYTLAGAASGLRVRLHLLMDTSVGITIWNRSRLDTIVNDLGSFDLFWYLVDTGTPGYASRPASPPTTWLFRRAAAVAAEGLILHDEMYFTEGLIAHYGAQLAQGAQRLVNCGEVAKVYLGPQHALYLFKTQHAARHCRLAKHYASGFRVL